MMWEMYDPETWDIKDVDSGNYAAFVYLMQFDNGGWYVGMKQIVCTVQTNGLFTP